MCIRDSPDFIIAGDFPELYWANESKVTTTTARQITCLKRVKINGKKLILAGGSDSIIDLFDGQNYEATLFH